MPQTPAATAPAAAISPVNRYKPQVLILAPQEGEDATCLSLVAQCLELGLSIELDHNWRLPTAPPRDLSAYKACLFPDSSRQRYDADLNAFSRAGGFLIYNKYYPVEPGGTYGIDHTVNLISFQGRDVMTQQFAAMLMQGGLTQHEPDFIAAMQARPLSSILEDQKQLAQSRYGDAAAKTWTHWKDPDCFFLMGNLFGAQVTGDADWLKLVRLALDAIVRDHAELMRTDKKISSQLENFVEGYVQLFAWVMLLAGHQLGDDRYTQAGVTLSRFWYEHNVSSGHGNSARNFKGTAGEDIYCAPGLYWLARTTGDSRYAAFGDRIVRDAVSHCQRPTGIWSHWINHRGEHQSAWCRATAWPLIGLAGSLQAIDVNEERARFMRDAVMRTFDGLAAYQDPQTGLWRNVVDEPFTRIESSGTCSALYVNDLLGQMGVATPRHQPMFDRAFQGLLPLCYRQGISALCRGTDYGPPSYYRSRPQGYSPSSSFFAPAVAARLAAAKD